MVHHYAYMMKMAEVCKTENYAEAYKDAKWRPTMEEEMWALDTNNTWYLVDLP